MIKQLTGIEPVMHYRCSLPLTYSCQLSDGAIFHTLIIFTYMTSLFNLASYFADASIHHSDTEQVGFEPTHDFSSNAFRMRPL